MNKKEINEIKKNFGSDSGFFTVNRVVSAFVDAEKNIKCTTNQLFNIIPQDECDLILLNLKKSLSGVLGKNLLEYEFPKVSNDEDSAQKFLYDTLCSKFENDEAVEKFLNTIVEKVEYVSTYTIFSAYCTYAVFNKNKNDEADLESDHNYNFILTAICPVNLRIDGLVYNEADNTIAKKESSDRIVDLPTDGFLFPLFSDRCADVNGVLYYTKKPKTPNTSIIEDLLGCEFSMSCIHEKQAFKDILNNVVADELDYDVITQVNTKIQEFVEQNSHETEIPVIDNNKLSSILWEAGVSQEKLDNLPKVYESVTGNKPLTASNLVDKKTLLAVPSITVNISKEAVDKVKTQIIDGRKCLVINLDDPEISVNGLETTIK